MGLGTQRTENLLLGALTVGAIVFVLVKAGLPWLALGLPLAYRAVKRFGSDSDEASEERAPSRERAPSESTHVMTRDEALRVLGLPPGASREQILAEYRRLMKKVHPDVGGTTYLAAQLNEAKDTLLGA
jgi:hypothetical protein